MVFKAPLPEVAGYDNQESSNEQTTEFNVQGSQAAESELFRPAKRKRPLITYSRLSPKDQPETGVSKKDFAPGNDTDGAAVRNLTFGSNYLPQSSSKDEAVDLTHVPSKKPRKRKPRATVANAPKSKAANANAIKGRAKVSRTRKPKNPSSDNPRNDTVMKRKTDRVIAKNAQPIHELEEIFEDMAERALRYMGFNESLPNLEGREIRIATMCSGTESPLLALDMVFDGRRSS